jgi:outer membrane murein-binding lipoprotein Lpp
MITKFGFYILVYTAVIAIIVYNITKKMTGKNKELLEIDLEKLPQEQRNLLSKIDQLEKKTIVLTDKLNSLQTTANLAKEQLDYTSGNFNSDLATLI